MNKENIKYLILGILIGVFSMKSSEVSWSTAQETMAQIASVDARDALTQFANIATSAFDGNDGTTTSVNMTTTGSANATTEATTTLRKVENPPPAVTTTPDTSEGSSGTTTTTTNNETKPLEQFTRHPGVVIAVKIHGDAFVPEIKQSFCLLHAAYNNRVLYDVLLFATIKLPEKDVADIQAIIHPAKLIVQYDTKTLQDHISEMTPAEQQHLVDRTNDANTTADITWHHRVTEGRTVMPIAYCWMSEFRSKHIWHEEVLKPYKYMMWYDSDAFATQVWHQDPVDFMVKNDLVLLTANYAQGTTYYGSGVQTKLYEVYNKTFCNGRIMANGRLNVTYGGENDCRVGVKQVHGFFHVTNLDFYREPLHMHWYDVQIGEHHFSRQWDDQLAVATPANMVAPHRTMEMEASGLKLEVMHNGMIMGKRKWRGGAYKAFFRTEGKTKFPEAQEKCKPLIKVPSR